MWWSPWSRDVAYMTSHGSVIRSGMLTTLSTDLSSIGLSVSPHPHLISSSLYPRLKNKWAIETHETSRRNWLNMYAKRRVCFVLLLRHILWSLALRVGKPFPYLLLLRWMWVVIITSVLGSESSGQSQQAKWNFKVISKVGGWWEKGGGGRRKKWEIKPPSKLYNTPHVICVLKQNSRYSSFFFLILSHKREEWRLTARKESS